MSPINLDETDEVWLALITAKQALDRNGHKAGFAPMDCMDCYTLGLIEAGISAYLKRHQLAPQPEAAPAQYRTSASAAE